MNEKYLNNNNNTITPFGSRLYLAACSSGTPSNFTDVAFPGARTPGTATN
jgi:hypothetical protein